MISRRKVFGLLAGTAGASVMPTDANKLEALAQERFRGLPFIPIKPETMMMYQVPANAVRTRVRLLGGRSSRTAEMVRATRKENQ